MPADPKVSEGARAERKALRSYLRRLYTNSDNPIIQEILDWVLSRQNRYDKDSGGLGRKARR